MLLIIKTILFLTFWGFIAYLFSACLIAPLLIKLVGETLTKFICATIACVIIVLYCLHKSKKMDQKLEIICEPKRSRKTHLLVISILSLAMSPFGFAGMLAFKPGHELSPVVAGLLCLVISFTLLYYWFNDKK